jgi:2,4-dienoyl-CoA reductase-like NADH-dependent reductase (Old Yellow Enzyme family)
VTKLFEPFLLRGVTARNRAWVSPMCQHSARDGQPTDWHLVHLGSRAVGGAGLVMAESTSVRADGRISPFDAGIWSDEHIGAWRRITSFVREQGALAAVQISHAGRKASTHRPWEGRGSLQATEGGWPTVGPTGEPFGDYVRPRALATDELDQIVRCFGRAASRASVAGFEVLEVHAAHGYLLHQFLSPLSNDRTDDYGGSFENRIRLTVRAVDEVRRCWPEHLPLFVRVSATDWVEGGWNIDDTVGLAHVLKDHGVDLIDVSTGGNVAQAQIPVGPGYQVPFAAKVKHAANIATAAVGLVSDAHHAQSILAAGAADAIMIGRAHLDDPYWARKAAQTLQAAEIRIPQYDRPDLRPPR